MLKKGSNKTLDSQHHQKLKHFEGTYESLSNIEYELSSLNERIEKYQSQILSNLSDKDFDEYLMLLDDKKHLEKHLQCINTKESEMQYFVDTADIIFKYYDVLEKGNTENEVEQPLTSNSILRFFTSSQQEDKSKDTEQRDRRDDVDRASLLDRYMQHTDKNYLKTLEKDEIDICPNCESSNRTVLVNDGLCHCNDCFTIETVIIDHEKPSYKDPPREITYFSYKRINQHKVYKSTPSVWCASLFFIRKTCDMPKLLGRPKAATKLFKSEIVWFWAISSALLEKGRSETKWVWVGLSNNSLA